MVDFCGGSCFNFGIDASSATLASSPDRQKRFFGRSHGADGKLHKPDIVTPRGRFLELKPDTRLRPVHKLISQQAISRIA